MTDLTIDAGTTLVLDGAFDGVVTFTGGASTLHQWPNGSAGTIDGLQADDTIYFPGTELEELFGHEGLIPTPKSPALISVLSRV